jgi:nucleoside-diphosphate-sugar epimerase
MKLNKKRVLVTGGAGFMGSEIVKQLSESGAAVTVLDNLSSGKKEYIKNIPNTRIVKGDIYDKRLLKQTLKNIELVINAAALPFIPYSYQSPEEFFKVNVMGTLNVLWESINSKTVERFVQISSSEVYGSAKYVPMDESHPLSPHSTYAVSKLASARLVLLSYEEHDFPAVVMRPFNSYGPNITQPYIIPEIIVQLLKGSTQIRLGNVESSRDFTYVTDTARGVLLGAICEAAIGQVINLGSGKVITIRELALLIASLMDRQIEIVSDPSRTRPFDVMKLVCNWNKARRMLSWCPEISLEEGLSRVIEWLKGKPEIVQNWIPYTER